MFEVGEYIVYGCKGVCQVEEITHIDIPGSNKDRLYYVLAPLEDRNGKIYAPTDNGNEKSHYQTGGRAADRGDAADRRTVGSQ